MLNIYLSLGELVIAFHTHTSHKPAKNSSSELSGGQGGASATRQREQPLAPLDSCHRSPCSLFKARAMWAQTDSAGLGLGKHPSPEAIEGQKLSPPSLRTCFKVLQSNPKSIPIPTRSQGLQWLMPVLYSPSIGENNRRRYVWVRGTNPLLPLDPQKYCHLCFEVFIFSTKIQNKFASPSHPPVPDYELFGNGAKRCKIHVDTCGQMFLFIPLQTFFFLGKKEIAGEWARKKICNLHIAAHKCTSD